MHQTYHQVARAAFLTGLALAAAAFAGACGDNDSAEPTPADGSPTVTSGGSFDLIQSDVAREASTADPAVAARAGADLGFELLRILDDEGGNVAISPYSIQVALAMTRLGARGETLAEMETVLGVEDAAEYDASLNALDQLLLSRAGEYEIGDGETVELELSTANSLWGQEGFAFEDAYLDELARLYGAGLRVVDYIDPEAREEARQAINGWVSEQTRERIPELIPEGILNEDTRLVLTNAVYLNAPWLYPFDEDATEPGDFTRLDGSTVEVSLMHESERLSYFEGDGFAAVELPYAGHALAMLLVVPDEGEYEAVASGMSAEQLATIEAGLSDHIVELAMPKFEFRTQSPLKQVLSDLGMPTAFTTDADFAGINTETELLIQDVLHEAFISVDEAGTEAAAATAVLAGVTSAPPPAELTIDRPFIFAIRDTESGGVVFLGQVTDPTQS